MGHNIEQHQATDGLVNLLTKANHDLAVVQHRLEKEFQQIYPENVSTISPQIKSRDFLLLFSISSIIIINSKLCFVSRQTQ